MSFDPDYIPDGWKIVVDGGKWSRIVYTRDDCLISVEMSISGNDVDVVLLNEPYENFDSGGVLAHHTYPDIDDAIIEAREMIEEIEQGWINIENT